MTKNGNKRPERRVDQISLSRWHNLVPGLWLRDASQVSAAQSATLFNDIIRPAAPVPASPGAVTWTPGPYEERLGYAAFAGLLFIAFLLSFDNASVNQDHFSFVFLYLVWCRGGISRVMFRASRPIAFVQWRRFCTFNKNNKIYFKFCNYLADNRASC